MELILALGIGVLVASGVWLILRPRTFQVIIGLSLIAYAVNLFIFAMGRLRVGAPPTLTSTGNINAAQYTDPVPQALVLTAIVISFLRGRTTSTGGSRLNERSRSSSGHPANHPAVARRGLDAAVRRAEA